MRGVNNVILIGNATRDAEPRHIQTGKPVSNIRLATSGTALDVGEEKGDGSKMPLRFMPKGNAYER
jgi:single-stranded DNA-binding protein